MKDSQPFDVGDTITLKYIKVNNERFSTTHRRTASTDKYIKVNNERFSTMCVFAVPVN